MGENRPHTTNVLQGLLVRKGTKVEDGIQGLPLEVDVHLRREALVESLPDHLEAAGSVELLVLEVFDRVAGWRERDNERDQLRGQVFLVDHLPSLPILSLFAQPSTRPEFPRFVLLFVHTIKTNHGGAVAVPRSLCHPHRSAPLGALSSAE